MAMQEVVQELNQVRTTLIRELQQVDRALAALDYDPHSVRPTHRRKMSTASRAAISAAQKKRWAKSRRAPSGKSKGKLIPMARRG